MHGTPSIWSALTVMRVKVICREYPPGSAKQPRQWEACSSPTRPVSWAPPRPGRPEDGRTHVRTNTGGRHRPSAIPGRDPRTRGGVCAAEKEQRYPADPPTVEEII